MKIIQLISRLCQSPQSAQSAGRRTAGRRTSGHQILQPRQVHPANWLGRHYLTHCGREMKIIQVISRICQSPQISCVSSPQPNPEILGQSKQEQMNKQVFCGPTPWTLVQYGRHHVWRTPVPLVRALPSAGGPLSDNQKSGLMPADGPSDIQRLLNLVGWPQCEKQFSALTKTKPTGLCDMYLSRDRFSP